MSHLSKIFTQTPVQIPNRSGFDLSFENLLTMQCGTLVPVLCEECMPNETFSLGHMTQIQFPAFATDFYGRIDFRLEAFFVPMRILWGGWQNFFTMPENNPFSETVVRPESVPSLLMNSADVGRGSLADYLGLKVSTSSTDDSYGLYVSNILPFIAYAKIYDDWYRNPNIQVPLFSRKTGGLTADTTNPLPMLPWLTSTFSLAEAQCSFNDGSSLLDLRQRNWAKDYYTTAALYPQASGDVAGSVAEVEDDTISINALRSANVLQRWLDRNNIAGERYSDQIKAHFGVMPSDAILDRPIFLGSDKFGVYTKSVYQTGSSSSDSSNPFSSVGTKYGSGSGFGKNSLIDKFTTTEHGYLVVLASIVPHAYYSTGVRRTFMRSAIGDFANPTLQGLGEQAIYGIELGGNLDDYPVESSRDVYTVDFEGDIFGYTPQYSDYKYHDDEVHGLLVDGENLEAFALQRSFDSNPILGSDFLQIPTSYLDQVLAASDEVSGFSGWADIFFDFKRVSPLSEYVIPTLGDLKNTHTEKIPFRGRQL